MTAPTPDEVEEMRARHPRRQPADHYGTDDYCGRCGDDWPCDAARLLALVDNQAGRLLAVLAALPPHDVSLAAQASWGMYAQLYVRLSDRIRRAATGEGT